MDDQELMTIREAAEFLKMHYQTVRGWPRYWKDNSN